MQDLSYPELTLITFVDNESPKRSELIVVDVQAFSQPAIARVTLPQRVSYSFHKAWVNTE